MIQLLSPHIRYFTYLLRHHVRYICLRCVGIDPLRENVGSCKNIKCSLALVTSIPDSIHHRIYYMDAYGEDESSLKAYIHGLPKLCSAEVVEAHPLVDEGGPSKQTVWRKKFDSLDPLMRHLTTGVRSVCLVSGFSKGINAKTS